MRSIYALLFILVSCGTSGGDGRDGKSPDCRVIEKKDGTSELICINADNSISRTEIEHGKDGADGKSPVCKVEPRGEDYFFVCENPDKSKYEVKIPKGPEGPQGPAGPSGAVGVKKKHCALAGVQTSQVAGGYPKFDLALDVAYVGDDLLVVAYKEAHYYRAESQPNVFSASQIFIKGEAVAVESTQWKASLAAESAKFVFKASGFEKSAACK